MKKFILDLTVRRVEQLSPKHVLLRLTDKSLLPEMLPGQFVEVKVDGSSNTFLRRPISINFVDRTNNELWLMVAMVGDGTRRLGLLKEGDILNCVLPLGNSFSLPSTPDERVQLDGLVPVNSSSSGVVYLVDLREEVAVVRQVVDQADRRAEEVAVT